MKNIETCHVLSSGLDLYICVIKNNGYISRDPVPLKFKLKIYRVRFLSFVIIGIHTQYSFSSTYSLRTRYFRTFMKECHNICLIFYPLQTLLQFTQVFPGRIRVRYQYILLYWAQLCYSIFKIWLLTCYETFSLIYCNFEYIIGQCSRGLST